MKTVTFEIDESTDAQLSDLAQRCDATPGQFVDMLCASLDRETLERVIQRAMRDDSVTSEPGVARMPKRRPVPLSSSSE
jgi:predicted transcriptional regulator